MKTVRIFVGDNDEGVWSIQMPEQKENEFELFFDRLRNEDWLYNFFDKNNADLYSGFFRNMTIEDAVSNTLEEIEEMEDALYHYAEQGFKDKSTTLQHLFRPLNNFEYTIAIYQKSKARIKRGWLRLYAIRLSANCYIVTGGAIKLTHDMNRAHLQYELSKLERVKTFLRSNGIDFPEYLKIYRDE
jgi:hypothetical protein